MNLRWFSAIVIHLIVFICIVDIQSCYNLQTLAEDVLSLNSTIVKNNNKNPLQLLTDNNDGQHDDTVYNFCPPRCSCLNDFFECKRLGLKQVPPLATWVRDLELTGNKLDDSVQYWIGNLSELTTLNLKKNRLQSIPEFKGLNALENLILAHNKIQTLSPTALTLLPNLKKLDLSRNHIQSIPSNSFPSRNRLNFLNFNFNLINTVEKNSLDNLRSLTELHLNHNSLRSLPNGIFKSLSTLKKLDLSDNQVNVTWATFAGLEQLRHLKLRANGITNLPAGVFYVFKSIEIIELNSNQLTSISRAEFFNLTSLQQLLLSNNTINRIEIDTWEYTQHLAVLDLSNNRLSNITKSSLEYLTKLKKLNLAQNGITHISDGTFSCVKNLEQLNLQGNQLSWMIEDSVGPFSELKKLIRCDLSDNNIKSINQKSFLGLESLEVLNLQSNNLTSIQFSAFQPLRNLHELYIISESFLCDCNLHWLYTWLKEVTLTGQVTVTCHYPLNLRGKALLSLKDEDFMCNESPKPRLITEPSDQLALKGENVTLECSAVSSVPSEMTFQWRRDNAEIFQIETETKPLTSGNNTIASSYLNLYNVNHDQHSGKYQCVVANSYGATYSKRFKITVATFPKFRKVPSNITLTSGTIARLDCSAYGEPTPQIAWQKDGGNDFPAARERRMHVMPSDHAFFIIDAKISDMGLYTCTAQNPAGIIKANATLTVYEPPTFVKPMESKEVTTGKSCVLECMSSGSPKPTLRWLKDDQPLRVTDRHFFAAEGQLLIIVDAVMSDAGHYKCEVRNELGTESGYLTLKVNKAASKNVVNVEEMTSIIIITVFCCAVGTSVIWVVIIYQTKKGNECNNSNYNFSQNSENAAYHFIQTHLYGDTSCRLLAQQRERPLPSQLYGQPIYNIIRSQNTQPTENSSNSLNSIDIPKIIGAANQNENSSSNESSREESNKPSNNVDDETIKSDNTYLQLSDSNNYCKIDSFDKSVSCRSSTSNSEHQLPQKTNSTNTSNSPNAPTNGYDQALELAVPLITKGKDSSSIYLSQDTTL